MLVCFTLLHIALLMLFTISFPSRVDRYRSRAVYTHFHTPYSRVYRTFPPLCELGSRLQGVGQYIKFTRNIFVRWKHFLYGTYSASLFDSVFQPPCFLHAIAHGIGTNCPS